MPLNLNNTGYNRILARVTDNAGNENWAEITIHILGQRATTTTEPLEKQKSRIAFVKPTFTDTAYVGNNANCFLRLLQ